MERGEYELMHRLESRMWWYRGLHALVFALLPQAGAPGGGPVLDAGCGTGGVLERLRRERPGLPVLGLEYDPQAAALAAEKSGAAVAVGTVNQLPFADGALGGIVCLDVYGIGGVEPAAALTEARRCLAPGGFVLLNLPAYAWMLSAHDARVHNVRRFTKGGARRLLEAAGFRVARATYWNTVLFPLMALRRALTRGGTESDVKEYPAALDRAFGAALALERAAIRRGLDLPFGGSTLLLAVKPAADGAATGGRA